MENIFSHAWRGRHGLDTRTDLQSLSNTMRPSDNGHQEFGDDQVKAEQTQDFMNKNTASL